MKTLLSRLLSAVVLLTLCSVAQQGAIVHVRGHITDAATHRDVAGASISSVDARHDATTDVNGFFSLDLRDGTKPGDEVRIHIEKQGYRADDVTEAASESVTYPIQLTPHRVPSLGPKKPRATPSDQAKFAYPLIADMGNLGGLTTPVQAIRIGCNVYDWPTTTDDLRHGRGSVDSLFHLQLLVTQVDSLAPGDVTNGHAVMPIDIIPEWNNEDASTKPSAWIPLNQEFTVFQYHAGARRGNWVGYLIVRKFGNNVDTEQGVSGSVLSDSGQRRTMKITIFNSLENGKLTITSRLEYQELSNERLKALGIPTRQAALHEEPPKQEGKAPPTFGVTNPSGSIVNQDSVISAPQTVINFAPPERHLLRQQKDAIESFLQGKACKLTMMGILENVPDAQTYAVEIADAFKAGGCTVADNRVQSYMADKPWSGVGVFYYDEHPIFENDGQVYTPLGTPQKVIINALESAQLGRIAVKPNTNMQKDEIVIVVGLQPK